MRRILRLLGVLIVVALSTAGPIATATAQESEGPTWEDLGLSEDQQLMLVLASDGLVPVGPWAAYAVVEGGEIEPGTDDMNVTAGVRVAVPTMTVERFVEVLTSTTMLAYLPQDYAYFPPGAGLTITALTVDTDVTVCPTNQLEIAVWQALGLQAFAAQAGLRTPDVGQSEAVAFLCRLGVLSSLYVTAGAPGVQFATPYPVGVVVLPNGTSLLLFATANAVPAHVSATQALDPSSPGTYTVRDGTIEITDPPTIPSRPTPEMVELAIALGWYTPPDSESLTAENDGAPEIGDDGNQTAQEQPAGGEESVDTTTQIQQADEAGGSSNVVRNVGIAGLVAFALYLFWRYLWPFLTRPRRSGEDDDVPEPVESTTPIEFGRREADPEVRADAANDPDDEYDDPPPIDESEPPWWGDGVPPVGGRGAPPPPLPTATLDIVTPAPDDEKDIRLRLQGIAMKFKGTGDIAGVAEALYEFDQWYRDTHFGPGGWFDWTNDAGDDTLFGAKDTVEFVTSRRMCCYEFVHLCAWLASDWPVIQSKSDSGVVLREAPRWGLAGNVMTQTVEGPARAVEGSVPRGHVIIGSTDTVNTFGYTHVVISLGGGEVIGLGYWDLEKEPQSGAFGSSYRQDTVVHAPYGYVGTRPAPAAIASPGEKPKATGR